MILGIQNAINVITQTNPMKSDCLNTQMKKFFQSVDGSEFKSFKTKIMRLATKNDIEFDEDVFMDTIVKCLTTFSKDNATNEEIEKYFWTAFKQNSYSYFSRDKFKDSVDFESFKESIEVAEYNADIDDIVNLLKNEVEKEFGRDICEAWLLHICEDYTYSELEKRGYEGLNLHNEFRQIKRYINNKIIKNNKQLKTLLKDSNLI